MSEVTRTILTSDGKRWRISLPQEVWDAIATDLSTMPVRARSTDPSTSKKAAKDLTPRAGTDRLRMLTAYGYGGKLTDEEAADLMDMEEVGSYWKRCSELRQGGYITPVYDEDGKMKTRKGKSGATRMVCQLTDKGRAALLRSE